MIYGLINKKGECSAIKIPAIAGTFQIIPIFMTRKDARIAKASLPKGEFTIEKMRVSAHLADDIRPFIGYLEKPSKAYVERQCSGVK
jgi:hypothetical protein